MKKFLLTLLAVLLMVSPAISAETGKKFFHRHNYVDLNDNDIIDNPYGVGLDLKVYDFKKLNEGLKEGKIKKVTSFLDSINIENKYDFENDIYSVYAVVSVDVTSIFQKDEVKDTE